MKNDQPAATLVQQLREAGAGHIRVVGGGGGVIVPEEIERLRGSGVTIFSPEDGQRLGLPGMINSVIEDCDYDLWETGEAKVEDVLAGERTAVARAITGAETGRLPEADRAAYAKQAGQVTVPVLGLTGTGGSGKSSLTDELIRRFRLDQGDRLRIAVVANRRVPELPHPRRRSTLHRALQRGQAHQRGDARLV